ncbi:MAG: zinc-binding alcohol dehydrogenase [Candidatus Latescibacteria bacterium]|nr:zinc-binding alcohol dehydrogenase [Candidatus Latescibacterota bacterium]
MSRLLRLHAPRDLRYEDHVLPEVGPDELHLRSLLGAISTGTESAWYFGTDPQLDPQFKPLRFDHPEFPRIIGYEKVSEVLAVGADVVGFKIGQRVVARYGHAEEYIWPASRAIPVPDDISNDDAILAVLMNVTSHGVRRSRLKLGDDVVITGMGPLGLLTLIAARLAGASRIAVCDMYDRRLELAKRFGADETYNPNQGQVASAITDQFGPGAFDVAFECSSSYEALGDAMAVLKRDGRVCVISQLKGAYSRHPAFGLDFHLGQLELISADGGWDPHRQARWYFSAIQRGAITGISNMITHRIPFEEIESGFKLIEEHPEDLVKIVITYP